MFQIVDVNDLTSTNVNGVGVVYAHVVTSQPQFGVKEWIVLIVMSITQVY